MDLCATIFRVFRLGGIHETHSCGLGPGLSAHGLNSGSARIRKSSDAHRLVPREEFARPRPHRHSEKPGERIAELSADLKYDLTSPSVELWVSWMPARPQSVDNGPGAEHAGNSASGLTQ